MSNVWKYIKQRLSETIVSIIIDTNIYLKFKSEINNSVFAIRKKREIPYFQRL